MEQSNWVLDNAHSTIQFKAKHLMITTVTGTFGEYNADITMEGEDWSTFQVKFAAQINSISTGNDQRDGHLKSDDFFNAEKHPQLIFKSTKAERLSSDNLRLHGEMTIRETTKPVVLDVEIGGIVNDPWGNTKAGFSFKGIVNRKEFGLNFHVVNDMGNLLVSDDIKLEGEIQLLKAVAQEA